MFRFRNCVKKKIIRNFGCGNGGVTVIFGCPQYPPSSRRFLSPTCCRLSVGVQRHSKSHFLSVSFPHWCTREGLVSMAKGSGCRVGKRGCESSSAARPEVDAV